MAVLDFTAVKWTSGAAPVLREAGASVAIGDFLYETTTISTNAATQGTPTVNLADANAAAAVTAKFMAITAGSSGDIILCAPRGSRVTTNAVLTAGVPIFLSNTAGKAAPLADLSGSTVTFIGNGPSTTLLDLHFVNTGNAVA